MQMSHPADASAKVSPYWGEIPLLTLVGGMAMAGAEVKGHDGRIDVAGSVCDGEPGPDRTPRCRARPLGGHPNFPQWIFEMKLVGSPLKLITDGLIAPNPAPQLVPACFRPRVGTVPASAPDAETTSASSTTITVKRPRSMLGILDTTAARHGLLAVPAYPTPDAASPNSGPCTVQSSEQPRGSHLASAANF